MVGSPLVGRTVEHLEVLGSEKSELPSLRCLVSTSGDRQGEAAPRTVCAVGSGERPAVLEGTGRGAGPEVCQ